MKTDIQVIDVLKRMMKVLNTNSDSELAESLGVASQTIATWKKRNKIPYEQIIDMSRDLDVSTDYLLFGNSAETTEMTLAQKNLTLLSTWASGIVSQELFYHIYERLNQEIPIHEQLVNGDVHSAFSAIWSSYNAVLRQVNDFDSMEIEQLKAYADEIISSDLKRYREFFAISKANEQ